MAGGTPADGASCLAQVSLLDFAPAAETPVYNVVETVAPASQPLSSSLPSAAGGVFAGSRRQQGQLLTWRVQGSLLELSELCLLAKPHARPLARAPDRAELALRFPAPLVPEVSVCQLADDSLLICAVAHAQPAGGHVFQLRFSCDDIQPDGTPLRPTFWLDRPEPLVMSKFGYADDLAGRTLGRLRLARFAPPLELGNDMLSQLIVLGGEGDAPTLIEVQTDFISREMAMSEVSLPQPRGRWGSVLGAWGAFSGGTHSATTEDLADLIILGSPPDAAVPGGGGMCALALSANGRLASWHLQSAVRGSADPPSATAITLQGPVPPYVSSAAAHVAPGCPMPTLAAFNAGGLMAVAMSYSSTVYVSVRPSLGVDALRKAAEAFSAMSWRSVAAPPPVSEHGAALLRLVLNQEEGAGGDLLIAALCGAAPPATTRSAGLPSLWFARVPLADVEAVGAWHQARMLCDDDDSISYEEFMSGKELGDAASRGVGAAAGIHSLHQLGSLTEKLLHLLSTPFRFSPRQLDYGCNALLSPASPSLHGLRPVPIHERLANGIHRRVGELEAAAAAEATVMGQTLPPREESEYALGSQLLSICQRRKCEDAEMLGIQSLRPCEVGTPLVVVTRSSLTLLVRLPGSMDEPASASPVVDSLVTPWHSAICLAWNGLHSGAVQSMETRHAIIHAVVGCCTALAASDVKLAAPAMSSFTRPAPRHLLVWLSHFHTVEPSAPLETLSVLELVLRSSALPARLSADISGDIAAAARAPAGAALVLLAMVENDIKMAQQADGGSTTGDVGEGIAMLLCSARLWLPLRGYLRLLRSKAPLHTHAAALADLATGRFSAAAACMMRNAQLSGEAFKQLNEAAKIPEMVREEALQGPAEESEWRLYEYLANAWCCFAAAGQSEFVLPFASRAVEMSTLSSHAPSAHAAAHLVLFTHALGLGRLGLAFSTLTKLDALAREEATPYSPAGLYTECRDDCINTLVSVLQRKRELARLAKLDVHGELRDLLLATLSRHALYSDVARAEPGTSVYEILYALQVRYGNMPGAAQAMLDLSYRLRAIILRLDDEEMSCALDASAPSPDESAGSRTRDNLEELLWREAAALSACITALEQSPPGCHYIISPDSSRAEDVVNAANAFSSVQPSNLGSGAAVGRSLLPEVPSSLTDASDVDVDMGGVGGDDLVYALYAANASATLRLKTQPLATKLATLRSNSSSSSACAALARPLQLDEIRRFRHLALARAALVAALGDARAPIADINAAIRASPARVLESLLHHRQYDAAIQLALAFRRELQYHTSREPSSMANPSGIALVAAVLAADAAIAPDTMDPNAVRQIWRRLRSLIDLHDDESDNFSISCAAAFAALRASPSSPLPQWLLDCFGASFTSASGADATPREVLELTIHTRGQSGGAGSTNAHRLALNTAKTILEGASHQFPAAVYALHARGTGPGGRGVAFVRILATRQDDRSRQDAIGLALAMLEPSSHFWCHPRRRNPAALCRALLAFKHTQLATLLEQLRLGCQDAVDNPNDPTARWITPALIDATFAAVCTRQGMLNHASIDMNIGVPGDARASAELLRCVVAVDGYLQLGNANPPMASGQASGERYGTLLRGAGCHQGVGADALFRQMLDAATR